MINEKLVSLYKDYYGDRFNDIIPCGVVDEETYRSVYPKIVFILREPHTEQTGWSIPSGLRRNVEKGLNNLPLERGYMYTWRQAGVWAYAIIHGFDNYHVLKRDNYVAKGLEAIGMTNLKKTGGGASSNLSEISYSAKEEKDLWKKELDIMNPHLIICGSTYQDVRENLNLDEKYLTTIDGMPYSYSICNSEHGHRLIIDFWHPGSRRNREHILAHLRQLIDILKENGYLIFKS